MIWHVDSGRVEPDNGEKLCVKTRTFVAFEAHLCTKQRAVFQQMACLTQDVTHLSEYPNGNATNWF
jgi:hypothetical protein